jgi:hypothetical protein
VAAGFLAVAQKIVNFDEAPSKSDILLTIGPKKNGKKAPQTAFFARF